MPKHRHKDTVETGALDIPPIPHRDKTVMSTKLRTLVSVLFDVSGSMYHNQLIDPAVQGVRKIHAGVQADEVLNLQLDFSLVGFADRSYQLKPFGPMGDWDIDASLKNLPCGDQTLIGETFIEQMSALDRYVATLRANALGIRAQMVFLITDGGNTGSKSVFEEACRLSQSFRDRKNCRIFGVGFEGADMELLARIAPNPLKLASVESFADLWAWIHNVSVLVTRTKLGEQVDLPNPIQSAENPEGFAKTWGPL